MWSIFGLIVTWTKSAAEQLALEIFGRDSGETRKTRHNFGSAAVRLESLTYGILFRLNAPS